MTGSAIFKERSNDMGTFPMWLFWVILMVVFLIIEAAAMGLSTIWCAAGCLVAAILAACGVDIWIQIVAMVLVSVALFILFIVWIKPNMKDIKKVDKEPTNADRLIGQEGIVTEAIDPILCKGQIKIMGQVWSAVSDKEIPEDSKVIVKEIKGVKLVVEKI